MPGGKSRRVVILTALPVEYKAVRDHLTDLREEVHAKVGTVYERGIFLADKQQWDVGIVEVDAGNPSAAVEAERAITYFKPSHLLFVGIAGGLRDVTHGDVVVATKVYGYESGRSNVTFETRPYVGNPTYSLEQRAKAEAKKDDWLRRLQRLSGSIPDPLPRVFVKPLAAGESVIASTKSEAWKILASNYSDAIAVEMEGHGFFQAVHAYPHIDALIIRGISDLIDDKSNAPYILQEIAARHASAFAFEMLAKLDPPTSGQRTGKTRAKMHKKKQESGEINEAVIQTQLDSEFLVDVDATVEQKRVQNFLTSLAGSDSELRDISHYFGERRITFPDQCIYAIKSLDELNGAIKDHSFQITQSRSIRLKADNIIQEIEELIYLLHDFSYIYNLSQIDQKYISHQRQIRKKFDSLIENLTHLVNEISAI